MNNSSAFAENLLSPLLRQREFSPFLSPFPTHCRRLSEDMADLVDFNLEQSPMQAPEEGLPQPGREGEEEDSPFQVEIAQEEDSPLPEEQPSPLQPHREDVPSTKLEEVSDESEPPMLSLPHDPHQLPPIEYATPESER
jgi:hypothetical protein